MPLLKYIIAGVILLILTGCVTTIPKDALVMTPSSLEDRTMQSRVYDEVTEEQILSTSVAILQDLGFTIIETETDLGLIVGEKDRSAVEAGQVAAAILIAALGGGYTAIDDKQKIIASLVINPLPRLRGESSYFVRIIFQRRVWNTYGQLTKAQGIREPEIYLEFFERLEKALFLEKQS